MRSITPVFVFMINPEVELNVPPLPVAEKTGDGLVLL